MRLFKLMILLCFLILYSCGGDQTGIPANVVNIPNSAEGNGNTDELPVITFSKLEHDFGQVIEGEIVTFSFRFKNTGKSDLVIANISTTCGCTASKYPKTPVKPGEENVVEVSFNSSGKLGFQNKTLTIAANTQPSNTVLAVKAKVIAPEAQ